MSPEISHQDHFDLSSTSLPHQNVPIYINTVQQLECAKVPQASIVVDDFVDSKFGLKGFSNLAAKHFPSNALKPIAFLPRQILTPCVESMAAVLLCKVLDLKIVLGAFTTDTFHHASVDKSAALKPREVCWRKSRDGSIILNQQVRKLTAESLASLSGRVIDSIVTSDGQSLVDYHLGSLRNLLGTGCAIDCWEFFYDCLTMSNKKPEFCFVRGPDNLVVRQDTREIDFSVTNPRDVRPPASWYYPLMFSLFVDKMILLETYENPRGSVSHAKTLFQETSDEILTATGRRPRVIEIPPLSKEMLYINTSILKDGPVALTTLEANANENAERILNSQGTENILELAYSLAESVLNYGKDSLY